ncbi:[FeFe] hydrogenase H-cluster maturation GTPase HydF [bacterium C-53]|nr:[FeFe] hydrogenase H-cluster maturation GTPase HydF [Lachnospiraceae bacterium]NBI04015.1 [FeFe] hydrogenase H-cluster maturation GTPase HydF [Lachnospiraceae bacterium]RKJ08838.1 [FeFe] hydrogenase H-cluster maturation GTPase HydF [bacterium C-53]
MGLNDTPNGERVHIGIFGKRNAGKSSIINAITGQNLAVVSEVSGTTTDPVSKAMELLPLGPVILTDTPGLDDSGELGKLRMEKTWQVLHQTDIAILIVDSTKGLSDTDTEILNAVKAKGIPHLTVYNKMDICTSHPLHLDETDAICVSAVSKMGIYELKEKIASLVPRNHSEFPVIRDLVKPGDRVLLVVPIDKAAPKGRLILPQQQTIRELLDNGSISIVVRDSELEETLQSLPQKPALVVTDSQVFQKVSETVPKEIALTSFSILFARHKGNLKATLTGTQTLESIKDGDKILICEGCTHHRQCGDIGTEKLSAWIRKYTGCSPSFSFTSGAQFPHSLSEYRMIIHCGGCMQNENEMKHRYRMASDAGIPMTNYGIVIAYMNGILERSIEILKGKY